VEGDQTATVRSSIEKIMEKEEEEGDEKERRN
jgi:hypothetical protein